MSDLSKPLVSVVISTYNYAEYLPTAVESVLNQTYKNLEIIIVNDGSTDNTDEVIAPYLKDERIKYIKQENVGQASAKNCGIRNSSGDYIAFLDADDYWREDKIEKQIDLFTADSSLGVVFTMAEWIAEGQSIKVKACRPHTGWVVNHLIIDNFVPFSSSLVKKECFKKVGLLDETLTMAIDWDIWLRISVNFKFDFVNEKLIVYRVGHPNQMSKKQEERQNQSDHVMNKFITNNPVLLTPRVLRQAMAYTYRNRGDYYQRIDKRKSLYFNMKSLLLNPFQPRVYLRICKALLFPPYNLSSKS